MAMTKDEHENLLKEIAMTGGDTDNMLKLMQRLRDDFDEREGMLRRDHETRDADKPDTAGEEKKIEKESTEDNREDGGLRRDPIQEDVSKAGSAMDSVSRKEYDDLRRKYIERFFGSGAQAIEDNREDVKKDDDVKNLSFDDLFKGREGMM